MFLRCCFLIYSLIMLNQPPPLWFLICFLVQIPEPLYLVLLYYIYTCIKLSKIPFPLYTGNSFTGSEKSMGNAASYLTRTSYIRRGQINQEHFDMLEYPFLTMTTFPPRFITQIGKFSHHPDFILLK